MRSALVVFLSVAVLAALIPGACHAGDEAASEALLERLDATMVNLSVDELEFSEVLDLLRVQTGITIVIDPRIASDVAENPITGLFVEDISLSKALDLLRDSAGEEVIWVPRGNVVLVTHRAFVPKNLKVRIYPVAALTIGRTEFIHPEEAFLGRESEGGPSEDVTEDAIYPFGTIDELMELIRCAVEPTFWEETEGADMRSMGEGRLVVNATSKVHEKIDAYLALLAGFEPDAIRVEIRAVRTSGAPKGVPAGDAGATALTTAQAAALLGGPTSGPALCLAVRDGMQSTAYAGAQQAYIAAYEARFAGGTSSFDPRVQVRETGMAVRVRALSKPKGGDKRIHLDLDVTVAHPTKESVRDLGRMLIVTLPGRELVRRESVLLLEPGVWHLAEGLTGGSDVAGWALLVRATPIRATPTAAPSLESLAVPVPVAAGRAEALSDMMVGRVLWEDANLDQVLAYLRTVTGLNFVLTPQVRAEIYEDVSISLQLLDVSVATILDLVTEPYEMLWRLEDNIVTIDMADGEGRKMLLRYFDVKDLTAGILIHANPSLSGEVEQDVVPVVSEGSLVDLIRETVGTEESWEDPASIEIRNRILIARNTPSVLGAVEGLLDGLRRSRDHIVTTIDLVEMDADALEDLQRDSTRGGCPLLLSQEQTAALNRAAAAGRVKCLHRERIISVEGSSNPRAAGQEVSYVGDYDIEVSGSEDASAAVPIVRTLHSGLRIGLRTLASYPANDIRLEMRVERSALTSMEKGDSQHGEISLPHTAVWSVGTGLRIPDGRTAVVCGSLESGRWRLLLVTPRRLR